MSLKTLKAPETGQQDYYDTRTPGFGVRVFKTGTKTFFVRTRIDRRAVRRTLGTFPTTSLADARLQAQTIRCDRKIADPNPCLALDTESEGSPSTARPPHLNLPRAARPVLFSDEIEPYLRNCKVQEGNGSRTLVDKRNVLTKKFSRVWAGRFLHDITKTDVKTVFKSYTNAGQFHSAIKAYRYIQHFFMYCVTEDLIINSPAASLPVPAKVKSRDRYLQEHEIQLLWPAAEAAGYPFGTITKLALLTAQRRNEVTQMQWHEINWSESYWEIPGTRTKNKRPTIVPLNSLALEILHQVRELQINAPQIITGPTPPRKTTTLGNLKPSIFVFPSLRNPKTTFSGFSRAKAKLAANVDLPDDWRLHDLRRTVTTLMGKLNIDHHIKQKIINHSDASATGIYDRFNYLPQKREAMRLWGEMINNIVSNTSPIRQRIPSISEAP